MSKVQTRADGASKGQSPRIVVVTYALVPCPWSSVAYSRLVTGAGLSMTH
jgi:hypothetical protein